MSSKNYSRKVSSVEEIEEAKADTLSLMQDGNLLTFSEKLPESVSKLLKALREAIGYSQSQASKEMFGVSTATVSFWETSKTAIGNVYDRGVVQKYKKKLIEEDFLKAGGDVLERFFLAVLENTPLANTEIEEAKKKPAKKEKAKPLPKKKTPKKQDQGEPQPQINSELGTKISQQALQIHEAVIEIFMTLSKSDDSNLSFRMKKFLRAMNSIHVEEQLNEVRDELGLVKENNQELQTQLEATKKEARTQREDLKKAHGEEVSRLKKQIRDLQEQRQVPKTELAGIPEKDEKAECEDVRVLREENKSLRVRIEGKEVKITKLNERNENLGKIIKKLEKDLRLKTELLDAAKQETCASDSKRPMVSKREGLISQALAFYNAYNDTDALSQGAIDSQIDPEVVMLIKSSPHDVSLFDWETILCVIERQAYRNSDSENVQILSGLRNRMRIEDKKNHRPERGMQQTPDGTDCSPS